LDVETDENDENDESPDKLLVYPSAASLASRNIDSKSIADISK
jgi:hypothetical protein